MVIDNIQLKTVPSFFHNKLWNTNVWIVLFILKVRRPLSLLNLPWTLTLAPFNRRKAINLLRSDRPWQAEQMRETAKNDNSSLHGKLEETVGSCEKKIHSELRSKYKYIILIVMSISEVWVWRNIHVVFGEIWNPSNLFLQNAIYNGILHTLQCNLGIYRLPIFEVRYVMSF